MLRLDSKSMRHTWDTFDNRKKETELESSFGKVLLSEGDN